MEIYRNDRGDSQERQENVTFQTNSLVDHLIEGKSNVCASRIPFAHSEIRINQKTRLGQDLAFGTCFQHLVSFKE